VHARKCICEAAMSNGEDQKLKSTFGVLKALCILALTLFFIAGSIMFVLLRLSCLNFSVLKHKHFIFHVQIPHY
jgi:hypothetical protein